MFELPETKPDGLDKPYAQSIVQAMSRLNVWLYRATGGAIGGTWRVGAASKKPVAICLLTTIGRKTGEPRTAPLLYMRDGERIVIVASQGGMPKNPLWYGNVVANPKVTIQIGKDARAFVARTASPEERAALWPRLVATYADYAKYERWTDRVIPVVICDPA